ncbi:hypothetical protein ACLMJK_005937 [Lecanora helva]
MRPSDPRIRHTFNQISQNLESANLTTQASLFSFSQNYVSPCLSSIGTCLEASCQPCFTAVKHDDRRPHHRQRQQRGRESLAFDFYDDWEQDEAEWGNDELDRLLSGDGDPRAQQPTKRGTMSYGTRGTARRKGVNEDNVNVVPKSSMFGFLERLPWKIGGRGHRYRPSVADLQENVGRRSAEADPLISEDGSGRRGRHGRSRSDTVGSRSTTNSLSSRGDLFPSEDEDDAVPIDDEFAMVLERRTTGTTSDDHSSRNNKKRKPGSRTSTQTASSKGTKGRQGTSASSGRKKPLVDTAEEDDAPTMVDLKQEEDLVRSEEEARVEAQRQAAQKLAIERGLTTSDADLNSSLSDHDAKESSIVQETQVLSPTESETKPPPAHNKQAKNPELKPPDKPS